MSTSTLTLETKIKLRDGNEIPQLGFGTYEMDGGEAYKAVTIALEEGYRLIDTAKWYENEAECGRAIRDFISKTSTPREEIFYTTKLMYNRGDAATTAAIKKSLSECGLEYIDLYLVHGPLGGKQMREASWKAILRAQEEGVLKSVGVSNYGLKHIQELVDLELPLPVVNQIDLHPFMSRKEIVELCQKHDIVLQAWAPLVRGLRMKHPVVNKIAKKYSKSPAQVLLRYCLQLGYVPIPKTINRKRIMENKDLYDFELSKEEMAELYALDEYLVTDWDVVDAE